MGDSCTWSSIIGTILFGSISTFLYLESMTGRGELNEVLLSPNSGLSYLFLGSYETWLVGLLDLLLMHPMSNINVIFYCNS